MFFTGKYRDGDETSLPSRGRCLCINDFASAVDTIIAATSNATQTTTQTETRQRITSDDDLI